MRGRVAAKTGGACFYCEKPLDVERPYSQPPAPDYLCVDHLRSYIAGGDNRIENLVPACWYCNDQKRSMPAKVFAVVIVLREFVRGGRP
jgi:5-methylcytosine-specific restriction endonuclease McrA